MPAISFEQFDALPDVLATDRFGFLVEPSTSVGLNGLNETLALRCQQVAVPEEMIEVMTVALQGFEYNFRGRHTFDKAIAGAFVETIDASITQGIRTWLQRIAGTSSGGGLTKKKYASQGDMEVYDQSNEVALDFDLTNLWPSQVPQVQMEGATAQPYVQNITFTYDRMSQTGVEVL